MTDIHIDLIPFMTFSESTKEFYGSIFGSVLGAIIGVLGALLVGYLAGIKEANNQKITNMKKIINNDIRDCNVIYAYLMNLKSCNIVNQQINKEIGSGIIKDSTNVIFCLNTHHIYPKPPDVGGRLLNINSMILWNNLKQDISFHNSNISNFNDFYILQRNTVNAQAYVGNKECLDLEVIQTDNKMIIDSMIDRQKLDESFLDQCMWHISANLLYSKYCKSLGIEKLNSIKEYNQALENMRMFKPSEQDIADFITKTKNELEPIGQ